MPTREFARAAYNPVTNKMSVFGGTFLLLSACDHRFSFIKANGHP